MDNHSKKDIRIEVVFNDATLAYVHKKAERIVSALYLVSGVISDIEPLRTSMRSAALEVVKDILAAASVPMRDRSSAARKVSRSILHVLALLDIALVARLVTAMNHAVIKRELTGLVGLLQDRYSSESGEQIALDSTYFSVAALPAVSDMSSHPVYEPERMSDIKDNRIGTARTTRVSDMRGPSQSRFEVRKDSVASSFSPKVSDTPDRANKSDRQDTIVAIIKDKKLVTIKDVSNLIKDCSEKTIQRELIALVERGVLKKEGERRWSTYTLA